jgi:hypothetical protein
MWKTDSGYSRLPDVQQVTDPSVICLIQFAELGVHTFEGQEDRLPQDGLPEERLDLAGQTWCCDKDLTH